MTAPGRAPFLLITAALVLLITVMRLADLSADPPLNSVNGTAWVDEGFWVYPVAWASVRGQWPPFEPPVHRLVPLYAGLLRQWLTWARPEIESARLLSVAAGLLTCGIMALMLRPLGERWALLALALHGTSPWVVAFDRLATPETLTLLCLTGALWVLVRNETPSPPDMSAATLLLALAVASKPVALFLVPAVAVFVLPSLRKGRHTGLGGLLVWAAGAALILGLLLVAGAPEWAGTILLFVERVHSGTGLPQRFAALAHVPIQYPFYARHLPAVAGATFLIGLTPASGSETALERRLGRFCRLWLVAWILCMPLTVFSLFRYAYLSVPVTILGLIGWRRWLGAVEAGCRSSGRCLATSISLLWLLALTSMQLSDLTGLRARVGFPLLLLVVVTPLVLIRYLPSGWCPKPRWALLVVAVMPSVGLWALDLRARTHLVAGAQRLVQAVPLAGATVCGFEAPGLFVAVADRITVLSSNQVWNSECRLQGRLADYVVTPRSAECTPLGSRYVQAHFSELRGQPALAEFRLPSFSPTSKGTCLFALVRTSGPGAFDQ